MSNKSDNRYGGSMRKSLAPSSIQPGVAHHSKSVN